MGTFSFGSTTSKGGIDSLDLTYSLLPEARKSRYILPPLDLSYLGQFLRCLLEGQSDHLSPSVPLVEGSLA